VRTLFAPRISNTFCDKNIDITGTTHYTIPQSIHGNLKAKNPRKIIER